MSVIVYITIFLSTFYFDVNLPSVIIAKSYGILKNYSTFYFLCVSTREKLIILVSFGENHSRNKK